MDALKELLSTNIQGLSLEKILGAVAVVLVGLLAVKLLLRGADRLLGRMKLDDALRRALGEFWGNEE